MVMQEAGMYKEAMEHFRIYDKQIVDKLYIQETLGEVNMHKYDGYVGIVLTRLMSGMYCYGMTSLI